MLRVFLTVLLPLAAPFLVYLGWIWLRRQRGEAAAVGDGPWIWTVALGFGLALIGFYHLYSARSHEAGTKLAPPALIDGVVVPSHPVE